MTMEKSNSRHVSIIVCHFSRIDEFGETSAGKNPPSRSLLLRQCVESILANTDYPAELIVCDNGTTAGNPDDSDYLLGLAREGKLTHVRFPQNMHFSFAWNHGAKLATGTTLSFICNDIEVAPNWLPECMRILAENDNKVIATPFITRDKAKMNTVLPNGDRQNPRSGSNCMVIPRELFYEIGEWPVHRIGGTLWYNKIYKMGIKTVAPPADLAYDRGWRHGVNWNVPIEVKKRLLDGSEISFEIPQ